MKQMKGIAPQTIERLDRLYDLAFGLIGTRRLLHWEQITRAVSDRGRWKNGEGPKGAWLRLSFFIRGIGLDIYAVSQHDGTSKSPRAYYRLDWGIAAEKVGQLLDLIADRKVPHFAPDKRKGLDAVREAVWDGPRRPGEMIPSQDEVEDDALARPVYRVLFPRRRR